MKLRGVCGFVFCVFVLLPGVASGHHQVVLVTNTSCPVDTIRSLELRKVYFGIKVRRDNYHIRALRNLSDTKLDQIFHQAVVAMSSKSYQRRLLAQILNSGGPRIAEFSNSEALIKELRKKPCNVTYMWEHEVRPFDDLKIIKLLWQKN